MSTSLPHWIDTHCHLDDSSYNPDRAAMLHAALEAGVVQMVAVATSANSAEASLALAKEFPFLYPTVGIHPNYIAQLPATEWDRIISLAASGQFHALGETGLDNYWDHTPFPQQEEYFARHWDLSRKHQLPVIIHSRDCDGEMLRFLKDQYDRNGALQGVMHCFGGSAEMARDCLAMGLYISFAGPVTYKNADRLRSIAATIPEDRIVVETDAPYLTPMPHRGKVKRNEPTFVTFTGACVAEARGVSVEKLAEQTTANARRLFKLPTG